MLFSENMSDEDLLALVSEHGNKYEEVLISKYMRLVRKIAHRYSFYGVDTEDLIQEGLLGLLSAIRNYNFKKQISFFPFANLCIRNRIIDYIRSINRQKSEPLNSSISLECFSDISSSKCVSPSPEEYLIGEESAERLLTSIYFALSHYEEQVLNKYLEGYSCSEIAYSEGKPLRSVENALQRIRIKTNRLLYNSDNSEN